jgi:hypothetical protein
MSRRISIPVRAVAASIVLVPLSLTAQEAQQEVDVPIDVAALQELDDDRTDIQYNGFTIDQIEDMNVVRNGEVIGEVEEVLGDSSGEVVALVVELRDGSLRRGDDEVVVPVDRLSFASDQGVVETTMSDEELAALPGWDD